MGEKLRFIISNGGHVKAPDYSKVVSKEGAGIRLAELALRYGHDLSFVRSKKSEKPFLTRIEETIEEWTQEQLNSRLKNAEEAESREEVEKKVKKFFDKIQAIRTSGARARFFTVDDHKEYRRSLIELATEDTRLKTVVVLAITGSDFEPVKGRGGISAVNLDAFVNELPKEIIEARQQREGIYLAMYKSSPPYLSTIKFLSETQASMQGNGLNLVIADMVNNSKPETYLVTRDEDPIIIDSRDSIEYVLLHQIQSAVSPS